MQVRGETRVMLDGGPMFFFTSLEDPSVKVRTRQDAPRSHQSAQIPSTCAIADTVAAAQ